MINNNLGIANFNILDCKVERYKKERKIIELGLRSTFQMMNVFESVDSFEKNVGLSVQTRRAGSGDTGNLSSAAI